MHGKSRGMQVGRSVLRGISASNLYVQPFSFGAAGEEVFHSCNKKSCRIRDCIDTHSQEMKRLQNVLKSP